VDRLTRKGLKQDKFAQEVGHTVEFLGEHRRQFIRYGAIALVVIVVVAGAFYFNQRQQATRQRELTAAMDLMNAPVGADAPAGMTSFPTAEAKDKAVVKAFSDLSAKAAGSDEGAIARYFLGALAANEGRYDDAVKNLNDAATSGRTEYSSLAKLTLADVYGIQGKTAEAEKLLRALIDKPTLMVPKEEATLALARLLAPTKPDEARKLLDPLKSLPGVVGRAATALLGEMAARK
jgi:predicted negative regulator of RcsB-dependent stress response